MEKCLGYGTGGEHADDLLLSEATGNCLVGLQCETRNLLVLTVHMIGWMDGIDNTMSEDILQRTDILA